MTWPLPHGTAGNSSRIRVKLATARDNSDDCPLARAVDARPEVRESPRTPYVRPSLVDFTLQPLMAALDLVEHQGRSAQEVLALLAQTRGTFGGAEPPAHPGLVEWTAVAIGKFLDCRERDQLQRTNAGFAPTFPTATASVGRRILRVPDQRGATVYETTAWGRNYESRDGRTRDLWLFSFGSANISRGPAEIAVAAYATALGAAGHHPEHVRVVDFGCGDGSMTFMADWSREQVIDNFSAFARASLGPAVDATSTLAGSSCVKCKALSGCADLRRVPSPLSMGSRQPKRRSLSATDLRIYASCPARYHLVRQLKLKSSKEEGPALRRGRAVDAWLNAQHHDWPQQTCRTRDVTTWTPADSYALTTDEAVEAARMMSQHRAVCSLTGLPSTEQVRVQPSVTCFDPATNVVWIAWPDLLHTRNGGWVWRETKTSASRIFGGRPLLQQYPQLALAVLMLNASVLDGAIRNSRVELEVLNPDDAALEELDPSQPRVVEAARDVINTLTLPILEDRAFDATPGASCSECEVLEWCRTGQQHLRSEPATTEAR